MCKTKKKILNREKIKTEKYNNRLFVQIQKKETNKQTVVFQTKENKKQKEKR